MDVTVGVKNDMSPGHFYSSKDRISTCMTSTAIRDGETACARFRDSREIRGPDSCLQGVYANFSHVRHWRSLWHALLTTIDYERSGETCPAECVIVCLRLPVLNSKDSSLSGPTMHHASVEVATVGPPREQRGSQREGFVSDQRLNVSRERQIFKSVHMVHISGHPRDRFPVTFYSAVFLTCHLEAEPLAGSACSWSHTRWLTARCGNGGNWPNSSDPYDSPVLTPSIASELPTWPRSTL